MGCGCGKGRVSRGDRMRRQRLKALRDQKKNSKTTLTASSSKVSICMSCPQSKQAPKERKRGIRICHKSNRLINNIIRDVRFICPIGKWKNSK